MSMMPWRWGVNRVGAYRDHRRHVAGCLRQSRHLPQRDDGQVLASLVEVHHELQSDTWLATYLHRR